MTMIKQYRLVQINSSNKILKNSRNNCFALIDNKCTALKIKNCDGCVFYKSKKENDIDLDKINTRIENFDYWKQIYIIDKYIFKTCYKSEEAL